MLHKVNQTERFPKRNHWMLLNSPKTRPDPFGYRALLAVALPLAATVGCFSITLFTDRTLLMWYGPTSAAASVSAGNLYWAVVCIPVTAMGFLTPLVAMAMGNKRRRGAMIGRVWSLVWQCLWLTLLFIPLLALIGWVAPAIFAAFGHPEDLAQQEARYFRTLLLVAPASMLEAGLTAFFVGRRVTRPILRANIASAVLNVLLDFWFIFGGIGLPAMGVFGAALATAVAMWCKVAIFAVLLLRLQSFGRHRPQAWRPNLKLIREIIVPGSTLGIQQLVRSSLFSFILLVIGSASVQGLAATSAALSLYQLLSIPAIGLATAVTVLTGQAYASAGIAPALQVIRRSAIVGAAVALSLAATLWSFPDALLQIPLGGLPADQRQDLQPLAAQLLAYAAVYGIVDISSLVLGAAIKGIGKTFIVLFATALPGSISVVVGWTFAPTDASAVPYWWTVLILWAAFQAAIIGLGIARAVRKSQQPRSAEAINKGSLSTIATKPQ